MSGSGRRGATLASPRRGFAAAGGESAQRRASRAAAASASARVVAARLEAAHEAAALEQHGVGLPGEARGDGGQAVEDEAGEISSNSSSAAAAELGFGRRSGGRSWSARQRNGRNRFARGRTAAASGRRRLLLGLLRRPLRRWLAGVRVRGRQVGGEGLEVGGVAGVEAGAGGRGGEGGEEVIGGGLHRRVRVVGAEPCGPGNFLAVWAEKGREWAQGLHKRPLMADRVRSQNTKRTAEDWKFLGRTGDVWAHRRLSADSSDGPSEKLKSLDTRQLVPGAWLNPHTRKWYQRFGTWLVGWPILRLLRGRP